MAAVAAPHHRPAALLVGPASVDRYVAVGDELPGGGALNMAYHWARLGRAFRLVTRVAVSDRDLFVPFLERHGIDVTPTLLADGERCSIDIEIRDDRQPWMDGFVEGIWASFEFSDDEAALIRSGVPTHLVLAHVVDAALHRMVGLDAHRGDLRLSGDFLDFRHVTDEGFAATFALLDVGFTGWPGAAGDPRLDALGARTATHRNLLVVTLGSRGVRVYDGRFGTVAVHWFDVRPEPVEGTTVGCGDAFIAAFLAEWHDHGDLARSVAAGRINGARATHWMRPLPDDAY